MPWQIVNNDSVEMAVHAVLLPGSTRGRVLYFGGDFNTQTVHLYDVDSAGLTDAGWPPAYNSFCSGHALLADGRVLVAGGQLPHPGESDDEHKHGGMGGGGERRCVTYGPIQGLWEEVAPLRLDPASNPDSGGRWYPTLTTLSNGWVLAVGGHPDVREAYPSLAAHRHSNNTPERYSPTSNTWTLLASDPPLEEQTTAGLEPAFDYHRNHLLPSGFVFFSSPVRGKNRSHDPMAGTFVGPPSAVEANLPPHSAGDPASMYQQVSAAYTSVLLPLLHTDGYRPRVLLLGDVTPMVIDLGAATPAWSKAGNRDWSGTPPRRRFATSVILPTGEVFLCGGTTATGDDAAQQAGAVLEGEIYDPGINWQTGAYGLVQQWETVEAAAVPRHYHATALLLPDGAVWTAGSNGPGPGAREKRIEVYQPSYFQPGRPTITHCPANISYGRAFDVTTPQASSIQRVAFIRCGSVTHAFNPDQRYISASFQPVDGGTLRVVAPASPNVAPPGYYMLWIVDNDDRPCALASFIRLCQQKPLISLDISTYSVHEVEALGTPANFDAALYLVYDGFLPGEVSTPNTSIRRADGSTVPGMQAFVGSPKYEANPSDGDRAQRIVFPVRIRFTNQQAFQQMPAGDDFQNITFRAEMQHYSSQATLVLSKNPNPRMRNGDPHYLSIDLRVFKTGPGETFSAGVEHPSGSNAPFSYIAALLQAYDASPNGAPHPFDSLPTDLSTNRLALYSEDASGVNVYNYAVARVRYRAPVGVDAEDVRVFFRLWTTGWSAMAFDTSGSHRRHGDGPTATPLLGLSGGEILNVPCFASPRTANMESQTDPTNRKTLLGAGSEEVNAYFGCWLDCNQDVKRFPLKPSGNGPYAGDLESIQELMRGLHQCLVAEIHYTLDPVPAGALPANHDNLAQRNLLLDETANPATPATRVAQHTFEIKPSPFPLAAPGAPAATTGATRLHPDELAIDWGNLPRESQVTFYLPQVDAQEVVRFAGQRQGPANLARAGANALHCRVTDAAYIPIPGPFATALPGLMTVQLPPTVTKGQTFSVVVRQVDGRTHRIVGTFRFDIAVSTAEAILPELERNLSVLKHIALAIPPDNRWHPVFQRYLGELAERVYGLGGDPGSIEPTPTGSGRRRVPTPQRPDETGKICRMLYDCFGDFEGFVLEDCGQQRAYACKRSLEEVVLRACRERRTVTVHASGEEPPAVFRLAVHC